MVNNLHFINFFLLIVMIEAKGFFLTVVGRLTSTTLPGLIGDSMIIWAFL